MPAFVTLKTTYGSLDPLPRAASESGTLNTWGQMGGDIPTRAAR